MLGIFGGFLCLPVAAVIPALFIMLACKIVKDEREFVDAYKAALAYGGVMTLVNLPFRFIEVSPFISLPIYLVVWAGVGGVLYAAVLEMDTGKAFLVWLTQQGMVFALCLAICLPIGLATGVTGMVAKQIMGAKQVAQGPDEDEEDLGMDEAAEAQPNRGSEPAADATPPPTPEGDSNQPTPEPEPTPDPNTPTPESTTPTPEPEPPTPTPEPVPEPVVPAAPPEPKFPPGLQGEAQRAFHEGRIEDGKNYLRAALLCSDDKSLWNNVRWYPGLGRPAIGLRFGIALQMAEAPPILPRGDGANQPNAATDGAGQPGLANFAAANDELSELRKFTGDFGPKLMQALPKSTLNRLLGPLGEGVQAPQDVQFVGVGDDLRHAQSLARQKGVDVLLVAAIMFKVYGANRSMDAQLTVRLVDVATEKRLWGSKLLSSNQVKAAINKGQNPFGETVSSLTDYLEHHLQPLDKPDLDNVKVRQRADAAAREESANPLPILVELRYYQLQGSITPAQAEMSYQRVVENEAASLLANGSADERRRVVERFLPRAR